MRTDGLTVRTGWSAAGVGWLATGMVYDARCAMLQERQALYSTRNKLTKAYDLGLKQLLPLAAQLDSYAMRRRTGNATEVRFEP